MYTVDGMPLCPACSESTIRPELAVCRPCYREFKPDLEALEGQTRYAEAYAKILAGQKYVKNRTPKNRARLAYAAFLSDKHFSTNYLHQVHGAASNPAPSHHDPPSASSRKEGGPIKGKKPGKRKVDKWREAERLIEECGSVHAALQAICTNRISFEVRGDTWEEKTWSGNELPTETGHIVRSREEAMIANYLWHQRLVFAYERKFHIADQGLLKPDFFIPEQDHPTLKRGLILEHFGRLSDRKYAVNAVVKMMHLRGLCDDEGMDLTYTDFVGNDLTNAKIYGRIQGFIKGLKQGI